MPIPVSRRLSLTLTLGLVALAMPSIALERRADHGGSGAKGLSQAMNENP